MSHDETLVIIKLKFVPGTIFAETVPRQNTLQIAYSYPLYPHMRSKVWRCFRRQYEGRRLYIVMGTPVYSRPQPWSRCAVSVAGS